MSIRNVMLRAAAGASVGGIPIPTGLIVMLNSASVPANWTRVAAADDRMIVVGGGTYAAGATGGAWTTAAKTSSSSGSHGAHSYRGVPGFSGGNYTGNNTGGAHTHDVTFTYKPNRHKIVLIKADAEISTGIFPANVAVLAEAAIAGLSAVFTDDYYAYGGSSVATVALEKSAAQSSAGTHGHSSAQKGTSTGGTSGYSDYTSGAHTNHGATITVTESIKQVLLRALSVAAEFALEGEMIAFWDGAGIPDGWTELTAMRDYFVKFNATGDGTVSGGGTINTSCTLDSIGNPHQHIDSNGADPQTNNCWGDSGNMTHSHTVAATDQTYLPPYYALKIIKCNG